MKRELAAEVSKLVFGCSFTLERSVAQFRDEMEPADYERYRNAIAEVVATIVQEILLPIHQEHPDLKPY